MVEKYRGGVVPAPGEYDAREQGIIEAAKALPATVLEEARGLRLHMAIEKSLEFVRNLNRFVANPNLGSWLDALFPLPKARLEQAEQKLKWLTT